MEKSDNMENLVFVFDMDGVLAIPYTHPEEFFPPVEKLLRWIHGLGHTVLVASFNPRAYTVMKPLYDEGVVKAIRAGSRNRWWDENGGNGVYSDEVHRQNLFKDLYISDMLINELAEIHAEQDKIRIHFFDDQSSNLKDVKKGLPNYKVKTHFINNKIGITFDKIEKILGISHFEEIDQEADQKVDSVNLEEVESPHHPNI